MTPLGRTKAGWLAEIPRWFLAAIFIFAGYTKMRDPNAFADSIASFNLLPRALIPHVALAIPTFELLAGVLSLTRGFARRIGALALFALTLLFLVALVSAAARGLSLSCGCFGSSSADALSPTSNLRWDIARDLGFAAIAGWLYWHTSRTYSQVVR